MNKYTSSVAFVLLSTFSLSAFSQPDSSVYKWVDAEKKVHYTDRPAPGKIAEQNIEEKIRKAAGLSIKKTDDKTRRYDSETKEKAPNPDNTNDTTPKNTEKSTAEHVEEQQQSSEAYAKKLAIYCKQQTTNLNALQQDSPIAWEEKGKTALLSIDQRKEKIQQIQIIIKDKCAA